MTRAPASWQSSERSGSRIRRLAGTAVAIVAGTALVAVVPHSPGQSATGPAGGCAQRVIVVDTSSGNRSSQLSGFADQLIFAAAQSAAVCGQSLSAYAVAGDGLQTPIITADDIALLAPVGPTPQIRAVRFGSAQRASLSRLVTERLTSAYRQGDPSITSVGALYVTAAQYVGRNAQAVFVSDGVNDDSQVDLNEPLASGVGARLAKQIAVSSLRGAVVTIVGLTQVDSTIPPPSPVWPAEIRDFNAALCHASHAARCRLFGSVSISEALDS